MTPVDVKLLVALAGCVLSIWAVAYRLRRDWRQDMTSRTRRDEKLEARLSALERDMAQLRVDLTTLIADWRQELRLMHGRLDRTVELLAHLKGRINGSRWDKEGSCDKDD